MTRAFKYPTKMIGPEYVREDQPDPQLTFERARVVRLKRYIKMLEDDLSYMGAPRGFTGDEWRYKRDQARKRLEKKGDL